MSEKSVKPVFHYWVRKREAREFHGSGLISNHVIFAHDVEISTIAKTEEKNEESKIESQTLHYMDVFSVKFVVQFFWERLRTKFFWRSRRTRRSRAIRWQFHASRYRGGSRLKQSKNGSRSRTNIQNITNHKHWNPSDNTANFIVPNVCRIGARQLFLTFAFFLADTGLSLFLCSQICCSILNCS